MMDCLKDEDVDWYRWLEKRVCVKGTVFGTLKYFGTTKFSEGLWCGVELDEPVGKNNGIVNNVKYFTCEPNFGIFVPENKVCKIESDPKNLDATFVPLNETVNVPKYQENTVLVSTFDCQPYNCNAENEGICELKKNEALDSKYQENAVLVSTFDSQPYNCNTENEGICELKKDEALDIKQDSEESLGLLDPNLIESWDSFILDTAVDIAPDFQDALLNSDNQGLNVACANLPTSDILFSEEISFPKYASTPRHPVKKRFTDFGCAATIGHTLQNVNEHNDVFENQMDFGQDVFFDNEKFKTNLNLASTSEFFQIPKDSSNMTMNVSSPVSCSPISQSDNLNKTQIIPIPFLTNQVIVRPMSMDLNKTQIIQNECQATVSNVEVLNTTFKMPTKTDSTEMKHLNLTVCLKSKEIAENYQNSSQVETQADIASCKNINLNSTFDNDLKFASAAFKNIPIANEIADCEYDLSQQETANICLSKTFNNSSSLQMNVVNKDKLLLQKTFVLDSSLSEEKLAIEQAQNIDVLNNVVQFETFDYKSKFLEETATSDKTLSDVSARNSVSIPPQTRKSSICPRRLFNSLDLNSTFKTKGKLINDLGISRNQKKVSSLQFKMNNIDNKTAEFKKPLSVHSSVPKSKALPKKSTSAKENSSYLKGSVLVNSKKPVFSRVIPKNVESLVDVKLEQEKGKKMFQSIENKSIVTSKLALSSHKFSYSQGAKAVMQSKTTSNLSLQNTDNDSSKISNQMNFSAPEVLPKNDLNVHGISKVPNKKKINQISNSFTKNPNVINLNKSLVSDRESKNNLSSVDLKLKQEKEKERISSFEEKSVILRESPVSNRRFSYSQSIKTTVQSHIKRNLPLPSKDSRNSNISNKINCSASKAVPTNDSSVLETSKVPLNNINILLPKKTISQTSKGLAKKPSLLQFKEQVVKDKLLMSRQSLGLSSNGCGIPRRSSLAVTSKINHPAGRYSMLPSVNERSLCEAKNTSDIEHLAKSNNHFVPEAVPKVSSHTIADSSKSSRIASSLPKSQILTRKTGQKYSDGKEESNACPKIPRYNLRGKK